MRHVFLRVLGGMEIPLGHVVAPAELPELLRHVAEYYDANPDDCRKLLGEWPPSSRPASAIADPFAPHPGTAGGGFSLDVRRDG